MACMESANPAHCSLFGATVNGGVTDFRLWAPVAKFVTVKMSDGRTFPMQAGTDNIFFAQAPVAAGGCYWYVLEKNSGELTKPLPDPVSRLLPEGVHGPTEIVDPGAFHWSDAEHDWRGLDFRDAILYELHVGTFTQQGTFDAAAEWLPYLKDLGVTAVELMPVAAFPGTRDWGYDGASPFAVQASYGGPDGLKRLVDAAHRAGLAIVMDVVYNHLGPEGNYLSEFGPYFTDKHHTPWGDAVNFDQPGSEHVRRYFIENALYWVREYHADGLRIDAIQTIRDHSPRRGPQSAPNLPGLGQHIVSEIRDEVKALADQLGRTVWVIAETDENDANMVRPKEKGGWGLDAIWSDDFHHSLHALLTGEDRGYYQDFGSKRQIVRALNEGFAYQGEHFAYWKRPRGTSSVGVPATAHLICIQNHDQVGNRALGDRLTQLVPLGAQKLAAALLLLAPETPLLFMGEEYRESAPFQFFADFGDPALQRAVSEGRRKEFKDYGWSEVPDPEDPATFERSKLRGIVLPEQQEMLDWYRQLIALRKRFVTWSDRTCWAELTADGAIRMPVPEDETGLLIVAEFPDRVRDAPRADQRAPVPEPAKTDPLRVLGAGVMSGCSRSDEPVPAPAGEYTDWNLVLESDADGYTIRVYESIVSGRE
jgi:maltooligosyltrehalose trehalohydrolase